MEAEFEEYENQPNGWVHLFHQLRAKSKSEMGSITVARLPVNQARNRYRDVLALDDTRVLLDDPENDYINANYVKVEDVNKSYILTQGPLRFTCSHFWQMVWEQNSSGIVMLNRIIEKGMLKCEPYWPATDSRSPMEHGDFVITLKSRTEKFTYSVCELELKNVETEETRTITHFQYTDWPDFGIPETPNDFLMFLQEVRDSGVLSLDAGPCVVHCSAGIGRSGTFCLVDVILARVEKTRDTESIDVQAMLFDMRKQRYGLIQSPDQLKFSYMAIIEGSSSILSQENGKTVSPPKVETSEELPPTRRAKGHAQPSLDEGDQLAPKRVRFHQSHDDEDDDSVSDEVSSTSSVGDQPVEDSNPPPIPPRPPSLEKDLDMLGRKGLPSGEENSQRKIDIYADNFDLEAEEPTSVKAQSDVFLGQSSGLSTSENKIRRREDKERLQNKVTSMQTRSRLHEARKAQGTWSAYWIMAAFAAVVVFAGVRWYFWR